jgi:hypothetical protein
MVYQWYISGMSMMRQRHVDGMSTVCRWYIDEMYHKTIDGYWLFGWPILQNPLQDMMSTPCIKEMHPTGVYRPNFPLLTTTCCFSSRYVGHLHFYPALLSIHSCPLICDFIRGRELVKELMVICYIY